MESFGIAFGGGGPVGVAWELGVVAGLAESSLQANEARVIVGTSAGSIVGALIRRGLAPEQLTAWPGRTGGAPLPEADTDVVGAVFELFAAGEADAEQRLGQLGRAAISARTQPVEPFIARIGEGLGGAGWPQGDLRITATDCESVQRRVWTAADGVGLDRAVTSSIAIPGIIGPVPVDGRLYMDGGLRSLNNVDVLAGTGIGRAVFIGPVAGGAGASPRLDALLDAERAALAADGIPLFVIGPGEAFTPLAADLLNQARTGEALEVGLADGRAAAAGLRAFLS